jgi:hypothetical protein
LRRSTSFDDAREPSRVRLRAPAARPASDSPPRTVARSRESQLAGQDASGNLGAEELAGDDVTFGLSSSTAARIDATVSKPAVGA